MNKIVEIIAQELQIKQSQVESTIKLIDEGNTIPFIARYRKEVTGGLSDEVLRNLGERLTYLRNLESRKEEVIKSIDSQGKLTQEIIKDLENCITLAEVEDIYRPYKQKKKTDGFLPPALDKGTQVGKLYTKAVMSAYHAEKLTPREASNYLLGLRVKHFGAVERWCY